MRAAVDRSVFPEGDPGRSTFRKVYRVYLLVAAGLVTLTFTSSYWSELDLPDETAFTIGLVLVAIGLAGRLWVSVYQAGHKNKSLLTTGPYSLCRNPMYFCNLLGGFGAALTTGTIILPAVFVVVYALHYPRVIRDEEARLRRHHGAAFDAYRGRTPMLLPSIGGFREPDEYVVRAREFSRRIPLALWPIVVVALIHLGNALHASHVLPTLLRIY